MSTRKFDDAALILKPIVSPGRTLIFVPKPTSEGSPSPPIFQSLGGVPGSSFSHATGLEQAAWASPGAAAARTAAAKTAMIAARSATRAEIPIFTNGASPTNFACAVHPGRPGRWARTRRTSGGLRERVTCEPRHDVLLLRL